jgi:putative lipoprotein
MTKCLPVLFFIVWIFPLYGTDRDSTACVPVLRDSWIAKDKARHAVASALIVGGSVWYSKYKNHSRPNDSMRFGVGFTLSLGLAKELSDARKPGGMFSWKDLAADALGLAAGVLALGWW